MKPENSFLLTRNQEIKIPMTNFISNDFLRHKLSACRLIAIISTVVTLLGCQPTPNDINQELRTNQAQFAPLLATIENYRTINGTYPHALSDLGNINIPQVTPSNKFKSLRPTQLTYEVSRDLTFFRISYGLNDINDYELYGRSVYSSIEPQWITTKYSAPLPHVEAEHYGAAYAASRSREKLDLAVQSLLQAARLNSDYPCRNFWHKWVIKSLGQGNSKQFVPSISAKELIVYADQQQQPVYAFAINEILYPSMAAPIKIVTEVYHLKSKNVEWKLLQSCDSSVKK